MSFSVGQYLESQYLKGSDLSQTAQQIITIKDVAQQEFQGQTKVVVGFLETPKRLICNKSQLASLAGMFGNETGAWVNQRVSVYAAPSGYQNTLTVKILAAPAVQAPTVHGEVQFQSAS